MLFVQGLEWDSSDNTCESANNVEGSSPTGSREKSIDSQEKTTNPDPEMEVETMPLAERLSRLQQENNVSKIITKLIYTV